jgi:hypothetical protein
LTVDADDSATLILFQKQAGSHFKFTSISGRRAARELTAVIARRDKPGHDRLWPRFSMEDDAAIDSESIRVGRSRARTNAMRQRSPGAKLVGEFIVSTASSSMPCSPTLSERHRPAVIITIPRVDHSVKALRSQTPQAGRVAIYDLRF